MNSEFNDLVRKAIFLLGTTQKELAQLLGISPSYFSGIKKGEKTAPQSVISKLSELISDRDCNQAAQEEEPEPDDQKSRLILFLKHKGLSQLKFETSVNLSRGFVNNIGDNIREATLQKITEVYPDLNLVWLKTGVGSMLNGGEETKLVEGTLAKLVPLLPIAAQGGNLNDFVVSVKKIDCEQVISPITGAEFAMPVCGDSMAPEYPNGSQIFIKKINQRAFVEWGKAYVLDTVNGTVIKILVPADDKEYVKCISINKDPIFAPFEVAWKDVFGVYRVLMCMSVK